MPLKSHKNLLHKTDKYIAKAKMHTIIKLKEKRRG